MPQEALLSELAPLLFPYAPAASTGGEHIKSLLQFQVHILAGRSQPQEPPVSAPWINSVEQCLLTDFVGSHRCQLTPTNTPSFPHAHCSSNLILHLQTSSSTHQPWVSWEQLHDDHQIQLQMPPTPNTTHWIMHLSQGSGLGTPTNEGEEKTMGS